MRLVIAAFMFLMVASIARASYVTTTTIAWAVTTDTTVTSYNLERSPSPIIKYWGSISSGAISSLTTSGSQYIVYDGTCPLLKDQWYRVSYGSELTGLWSNTSTVAHYVAATSSVVLIGVEPTVLAQAVTVLDHNALTSTGTLTHAQLETRLAGITAATTPSLQQVTVVGASTDQDVTITGGLTATTLGWYGDSASIGNSGAWIGFNYGGTPNITIDTSGTLTANGGTLWHSLNDGASSGLDADLLDGQSSAAFVGNPTSTTINAEAVNAWGAVRAATVALADSTTQSLYIPTLCWDSGQAAMSGMTSMFGPSGSGYGSYYLSLAGVSIYHIRGVMFDDLVYEGGGGDPLTITVTFALEGTRTTTYPISRIVPDSFSGDFYISSAAFNLDPHGTMGGVDRTAWLIIEATNSNGASAAFDGFALQYRD